MLTKTLWLFGYGFKFTCKTHVNYYFLYQELFLFVCLQAHKKSYLSNFKNFGILGTLLTLKICISGITAQLKTEH